MKKCKHCNISYNTERHLCPFCKNILDEDKNASQNYIYQPYPKFTYKTHKINIINRIFLFLSLLTILIVLTTNYNTYINGKHSLWSIIIVVSILTIWSLVKGLIISNNNPARKIFRFCLCLIILIVTIEYFPTTNKATYYNWSFNYVIPFLLIATLTALNMLTSINHKNFSNYIGYLLWVSIILILYNLLYIFNFTNVLWPSLTCLIYGISNISAMFIFGGTKTKEELKKRFTL